MAELPSLVGSELGPSSTIPITQERINAFAEATLDGQWIHVDPERAAAGPFGGTIAHGFLTLSLLSCVVAEVLLPDDAAMAINYGLNRVRFPAILRSGSALSGTLVVLSVSAGEGYMDVTSRVTFVADGAQRPCCVAEIITRYLAAAPSATAT